MKTNINNTQILKLDATSLPDNIVGVAACIKDNEIYHAGLFIKYDGDNYLLHFTGEEVEFRLIDRATRCFFKHLIYIPGDIVPSTYLLFKKISESRKPGYSYFYNGSCYDSKSVDFLDEFEMPEIMSCVGFCLNVLKTVLGGQDFLKYTDWYYHNGVTEDDVKLYFMQAKENYPEIDLVEFSKHVRRILPVEFITAGFGEFPPVAKSFTDANWKEVKQIMIDKIAS